MRNIESFKASRQRHRWSLSVANAATVFAMGIVSSLPSVTAHAQSTTAHIFGQAPAGETVTALSSTGMHRHETVSKNGHYKIDSLPAGDYTVTLAKDKQTVDTRAHVPLIAGRGAEIDFACPNDQCAAADR